MKSFSNYIAEDTTASKQALTTYIANNLYRMGNRKNSNPSSMLLLIAAAIMNNSDDAQSISAARRLTQLAISKQQRT